MRAVVLLLLGASTLSSSPQNRTARPPTLPYVDAGMCPFECCTYRAWTVETATVARVSRSPRSAIAFRMRKGEVVTGVTGLVVTKKFGTVIIREATSIGERAIPIKPGDIVHVIGYVGEGFWKFWVKGQIDQEQLPTKDQGCAGEDRHPVGDLPVANPVACDVQIDLEPETEWWAKLRNSKGQVGWTKDLENFGNIDACG